MRRLVPNRVRGFSLVEMSIALLVLLLVSGALLSATEGMGRSSSSGRARSRLQQEGAEALLAIQGDLFRSGYVRVQERDYPYVFDGGIAEPPFEVHGHPPPTGADYDKARGLREIVLVLPADLDRDGRPDRDGDRDGVPELDGNGDGLATDEADDVDGLWDPLAHDIDPTTGVVWSQREVSYVVSTDPDGRDALYRRIDGLPEGARRVARGVVALRIDTPASSGFTLPLDTVQVHLELRDADRLGAEHVQQFETLVRLRNH